MRFLILGNASKPAALDEARRLERLLPDYGTVVLTDLEQKADLSQIEADLAFVLGGDGAILRAARQMGYRQVPVLGVNLGRLGFLADLAADRLEAYLPHVARREYTLTRHLMFEAHVPFPGGARTFLGLNDVVIRSGPPFHMIHMEVRVDGEPAMHFLGDGLIVSTPVGSTAHALSAGGPILGQALDVFAVTPICAHTLTARPLIESAERQFEIRTLKSNGAFLTLDGQEHFPLPAELAITVRRAPVAFTLVKLPGKSYFQTLREKLRWGQPPEYRPEPGGGAKRISEE